MKRISVLLILFFVLFYGCSPKVEERGNSGAENDYQLSFPREQRPKKKPVQSRLTMVYVDSIPAGAEVILVSREEAEDINSSSDPNEEKLLGVTPLSILPTECPTMTFWIKMNMETYIQSISRLPQMKDWIGRFESGGYSSFGGWTDDERYFDFETPISKSTSSTYGRLLAIGPICPLDYPEENRVCILFVPRKAKISWFYPLMPPPGTFPHLEGSWPQDLLDYGFSREEMREILGSMTRCGKYIGRVLRDEKTISEYVITYQGPGNDMIVTHHYVYEIIPGYND